jgi:hypothetical protein
MDFVGRTPNYCQGINGEISHRLGRKNHPLNVNIFQYLIKNALKILTCLLGIIIAYFEKRGKRLCLFTNISALIVVGRTNG